MLTNAVQSPAMLRIFIGGAFLLLLVYRLVISFSYAPEVVLGESNNIWNALKVSRGLPIYSDPEQMPLEVFQYTPMSQLPLIVAAQMGGPEGPERIHRVTVVGRLFSLLFNVVAVLLLCSSAGLLFPVSRTTLTIGGLLAFASFTHLAFAIRPDALALMLMMLGFYLFCWFYAKGRQGALVASAMVLAVAFMAKQDAMVVIAPLSFLLLVQQRWRQLLFYDGIFLLTLGALVLAGHLLLGEHFLRSVVMGVRTEVSGEWAGYILMRLFSFFGVLVVLGNAAIVAGLWRFRSHPEALPFVLVALFYELFAVLTSFKIGAGMSYYTPFIHFSCMLIVVLASEAMQRRAVPAAGPLMLAGVLVISAVFIYRQAFHYTAPFLRHAEARSGFLQRWQQTAQLREDLALRPTDRLLAPDPLTRLMLAANIILPNTEYYGVSPFPYDDVKNREVKPLEYMVLLPRDTLVAREVMAVFHVEESEYVPYLTRTEYRVLARKDLVH
jgi:hypothetical protein